MSLRTVLFTLGLWGLLWAGLNTWPERLFSANSLTDLLHGLRAFLPIAAAYLAGLMILIRRSTAGPLLRAPLGLIGLYGLTGILASLLLSPNPPIALYWVAVYISVLPVTSALLLGSQALARARALIELNWLFMAAMTSLTFAFIFGALSQSGASLLTFRRVELINIMPTIIDMPMVRSTGVARYAAVVGLVALARFWRPRSRRLLWSALLILSLIVLLLSQSRAALLGFAAGGLLVLWLQRGWKVILMGAAALPAFLWAAGLYKPLWEYLLRGQSLILGDPTGIFTLTGRTVTWEAGWRLFEASPLLGFGFQADRFLLEGQHMHNAWLQALVQTGLVGAIPFMLAVIAAWLILFRLLRRPSDKAAQRPFLIEIAGVLAFLTVRGLTESTGAFYGVDWLLLAPLLAYVTILNRGRKAEKSDREVSRCNDDS